MIVYIECEDCGYRYGGQSLSGPKDKVVEIHSTCQCTKKIQAENAKLKGLIAGNEEVCKQRNNEMLLHKAAARAAKSGLKSDLKAYIKLVKELQ